MNQAGPVTTTKPPADIPSASVAAKDHGDQKPVTKDTQGAIYFIALFNAKVCDLRLNV